MVRAVPGARAQLQRLLGSTERPTWLVQWQDDDRWGLDRADRMDHLIARGYRLAAVVCGHPIYLRSDGAAPHRMTGIARPSCADRPSESDRLEGRPSSPRREIGAIAR
jgi:hypothetical protein